MWKILFLYWGFQRKPGKICVETQGQNLAKGKY